MATAATIKAIAQNHTTMLQPDPNSDICISQLILLPLHLVCFFTTNATLLLPQLTKAFSLYHATAPPDVQQMYDLTAQFLWAVVTMPTTPAALMLNSQLAIPITLIQVDASITWWATACFTIYSMLPMGPGAGNSQLAATAQAMVVLQATNPTQQQVNQVPAAAANIIQQPASQVPALPPPPTNNAPTVIQPPPVILPPPMQPQQVIDMTAMEMGTAVAHHAAFSPGEDQMVTLFTESILWPMDWAPQLQQQNQVLNDAFPKQAAPLTGIERTNLYSWCGLLPNEHLPLFWSALLMQNQMGCNTLFSTHFSAGSNRQANVLVQYTTCTKFLCDLKTCDFFYLNRWHSSTAASCCFPSSS